jgi:hypothetical protein
VSSTLTAPTNILRAGGPFQIFKKGPIMVPNENPKDERRRNPRILKNFILSYFEKSQPDKKFEITQLRNISQGGMCFVTSQSLPAGLKIGVELRTPYLAETSHLYGEVLQSHDKVKGILYETRIRFEPLDPEAEFLLSKLIELFLNGDKTYHE